MVKNKGWTKNGRMFTQSEFNNSFLKQNSGISYSEYKKFLLKSKNKSTTKIRRTRQKASNNMFGNFGNFGFFR